MIKIHINNQWVEGIPIEGGLTRKYMSVGTPLEHYIEYTHVTPSVSVTAKEWRNLELSSTDWLVPIIDHPQHSAYLSYRQALRDWPDTESFPDTRPTLGS